MKLLLILLLAAVTLTHQQGETETPPPTVTDPPPAEEGCEDGWLEKSGSCYYISGDGSGSSYEDAKKDCEMKGATLVNIGDEKEQKYLMKKRNKKIRYWLGLTREEKYRGNSTDEGWMWPDGSDTMNYSNWRDGQPRIRAQCVVMRRKTGEWDGRSCRKGTFRYICEKPLPDECEEGWEQNGLHCYYFSGTGEGANFEDARAACQDKDAELTSSLDADENQFLVDTRIGRMRYWLGLYREADSANTTEDGWGWVDGNELDFSDYREGNPRVGHQCTMFRRYDGLWKSSECDIVVRYICKKWR